MLRIQKSFISTARIFVDGALTQIYFTTADARIFRQYPYATVKIIASGNIGNYVKVRASGGYRFGIIPTEYAKYHLDMCEETKWQNCAIADDSYRISKGVVCALFGNTLPKISQQFIKEL